MLPDSWCTRTPPTNLNQEFTRGSDLYLLRMVQCGTSIYMHICSLASETLTVGHSVLDPLLQILLKAAPLEERIFQERQSVVC